MYNCILEFNPSLIVVSYSQKVRIEEDVWVGLVKEFTVLAGYRVVMYCNVGKNYMFEEYYSQDMQGV